MYGSFRRHRAAKALIALGWGVLIGACGSAAKQSGAAGIDPGVQFSQCMRTHGVPNFPDPTSSGNLNFTPSSGLDTESPAFQSAQQACQRFEPLKGAPPTMTASQYVAALRFARCMRAHDQPTFPDPTRTVPRAASRVLVLRGMEFAPGPGIDPSAPAFEQAANACGVRFPRQLPS
jgi:hypothetical protein